MRYALLRMVTHLISDVVCSHSITKINMQVFSSSHIAQIMDFFWNFSMNTARKNLKLARSFKTNIVVTKNIKIGF